jgi:mRNA-degrading endonuclease RelE of RelBE toxin-antitoxin system
VSWQVDLAREAKKELARLPTAVQKRVARVLLALEEEPFPPVARSSKTETAGACAWVITEFSTLPTKRRERLSWA